MRTGSSIAFVAAVFLAAAPAAHAAEYNGLTVSQLQAALRGAGIAFSTTANPDILRVEGAYVYLTDCRQTPVCAEINFFNNFSDVRPTLEAVNRWNNTKKIPEASVNADGSLHMEMWLSAIGVTDANIVDSLGWFKKYTADAEFWGPYMVRPGV